MTEHEIALTSADEVLKARRDQGRKMRNLVHGVEFVAEAERQTDSFLKMYYDATEEFCWGSIWARDLLPVKERSMLALCMTAAKGQYPAVAQHVHTALRAGWNREEIGEMLLHVYCYAGCYASLGGFKTAKDVFDEIDGGSPGAQTINSGGPLEIPVESRSKRIGESRSPLAERGLQIQRELLGDEAVEQLLTSAGEDSFFSMFADVSDEYCFGTVWARAGLGPRHRSMMSLAIVSAQGQFGAISQNVRSCVHQELSKEEIGEILLQVFVYAGVSASLLAFQAARDTFDELKDEGTSVPFSKTEAGAR